MFQTVFTIHAEVQLLLANNPINLLVAYLGMNEVTTQPSRPESTVMRARAEIAPRKTVSLLFVMAMMAATGVGKSNENTRLERLRGYKGLNYV